MNSARRGVSREEVEKVLEKKVRPVLRADGGDLELVGITGEGLVQIRLMGACAGCPFSLRTKSQVIEELLKREVKGVKGVLTV